MLIFCPVRTSLFDLRPNLLPAQGDVRYIDNFFAPDSAEKLLQKLTSTLAWKHESILMFGKRIPQPRLTAWYGDPGAAYSYSGIKLSPAPWTETLKTIKDEIEQACQFHFNSALVNLYRDGRDSMGWHQDDEKELGKNPTIASLSLGARRVFRFRHNDRSYAPLSIELGSGSLLLMRGKTQHIWAHSIPKTTKILPPRLNITFRYVYGAP